MDFLQLIALIIIIIQLYKLSQLFITIDQQKLDVDAQDKPSGFPAPVRGSHEKDS